MATRTRACAAAAGLGILLAGAVPSRAEGPAEPSGAAAQTLRLTGSSTMCPLVAAIGKRFETVRPGVRVEVQCGGSDRGIRDVRGRVVDLGMMARALRPGEEDLIGFPIARDGVSVIVNAANPLGEIPSERIAAVFSGKVSSWRELGGEDAPITVILREETKPVTELFKKYFRLEDKIRGSVIPGDNPVTIQAVAADPRAIGYVSSGEAERKANAGIAIRLVPIGGVMPTERNIITGNYPITRALSLITLGLPSGLPKQFIDYCLSSKVVDLIEQYDFVPYRD